MIKLDRRGVRCPADWGTRWEGKLPDAARFKAEGARFEAVDINDPSRRGGFGTFSPTALPTRTDKSGKTEAYYPDCWTDDDVRDPIRRLSGYKCAWCEQEAEALRTRARTGVRGQPLKPRVTGRKGDVEHVRPKSLFPLSAYDHGNYVLSCSLCNQWKADKWPDTHDIFRPDRDDPENALLFLEDGRVQGLTLEARWVIRELGLDAPELRRKRKAEIELRLSFIRFVLSLGLPEGLVRAQVRTQLAGAETVFAGAINQCVRRAWAAVMGTVGL